MTRTEYVTRPIEADDQAVLWEAIYHSIFLPPGEPPIGPEVVCDPLIARYVENWGAPDDLGVVAVRPDDGPVAGRVFGAAWVRLLAGERKGFGHVDDQTPELAIAVWPGHRGRGIGTRMLEGLFRQADNRWEAISLSVSKANPAVRLYERFGFKVVRDDRTTLVMRRPSAG